MEQGTYLVLTVVEVDVIRCVSVVVEEAPGRVTVIVLGGPLCVTVEG